MADSRYVGHEQRRRRQQHCQSGQLASGRQSGGTDYFRDIVEPGYLADALVRGQCNDHKSDGRAIEPQSDEYDVTNVRIGDASDQLAHVHADSGASGNDIDDELDRPTIVPP